MLVFLPPRLFVRRFMTMIVMVNAVIMIVVMIAMVVVGHVVTVIVVIGMGMIVVVIIVIVVIMMIFVVMMISIFVVMMISVVMIMFALCHRLPRRVRNFFFFGEFLNDFIQFLILFQEELFNLFQLVDATRNHLVHFLFCFPHFSHHLSHHRMRHWRRSSHWRPLHNWRCRCCLLSVNRYGIWDWGVNRVGDNWSSPSDIWSHCNIGALSQETNLLRNLLYCLVYLCLGRKTNENWGKKLHSLEFLSRNQIEVPC